MLNKYKRVLAYFFVLLFFVSKADAQMLYPVSVNEKWGYINEKGVQVVKPQYIDAKEFKNGLAAVLDDNVWGYIDLNGKLVIKPQYSKASDFSEAGLAEVSQGKVAFYIDKKGDFKGKQLSTTAPEGFSEGLIRNREANKWGYKNITGKLVISYQYDWAGKFSGGFAPVKRDGKYGYVDKNGKEIQLKYDLAKEFQEGLAAVIAEDKLGFINTEGKMVIKPQYDAVEEGGFNNGFAIVRVNDKYGYINKKGEMIVTPQYIRARSFSIVGLAPVFIGNQILGKWGFIDQTGRMVIEPAFDDAKSFVGSLAYVRNGSSVGYINAKGEFIWKQK